MTFDEERASATIGAPQDSDSVLADQDLHRVIGHIQGELRMLEKQRATIVRRIAMIKQTIAGLGTLFGPRVIDEDLRTLLAPRCSPDCMPRLGLTNCCRQLLRSERSPRTLDEMLRAFREQYPEIFAAQEHPANSLRTVLRRLVMYGEAVQTRSGRGLRTWQATSTAAGGAWDTATPGGADGISHESACVTTLHEAGSAH